MFVQKRGQVTLFIVIGIVMLAVFAFLFYINSQPGEEFVQGILSQLSTGFRTASFESNVQTCLEQTTRQGIDYFGVTEASGPLIEHYIKSELPNCIDFDAFEELGMDIETGELKPSVVITQKSVVVDVTYPMTVESQGSTFSMDYFRYYLRRESSAQLTFDIHQRTIQEHKITTEDNDAKLIILAGAKVSDENREPINKVSMKILERNFDGLSNSVVVGMIVYKGLPEGTYFDPPPTLTISYNPSDVPPGVAEESLRIAWFDKQAGIWRSLPSTVDTTKHTVTAHISHFTYVAIVARCGYWEAQTQEAIQANEQVIGGALGELIFEQTCGESIQYSLDEGWLPGGSCLDVGVDNWEYDEENSYFYESDEPGYMQKVQSINPNPASGQVTAECMQKDWDKGTLTPQTFGYEEYPYSGGYGYLSFEVKANGDSCIATDGIYADIDYDVKCGEGDVCIDEQGKPTGLFRVSEDTESIDFETIKNNWDEWRTQSRIQAGLNRYWLKIENANDDGCAWAAAKLTLTGTGITWQPKAGLASDCTIQERINFLCRLGDPNFPNSCSDAWTEYGEELTWLVNARAEHGSDALLEDTGYIANAPKLGPEGCGRGYTPEEYCCCNTADTSLQNKDNCKIMAVCVNGYTVQAYRGACEKTLDAELPPYEISPDEETIRQKIIAEAIRQGVPWEYALGIAYVEHHGRLVHEVPQGAISQDSSHSVGLFQVVPRFHVGAGKTCGDIDISDLDENIECGVKIIKKNYYEGCVHYHEDGCRNIDYCGWDKSTRSYIGWACKRQIASCDQICVLKYDHYVELAQCYMEQFDSTNPISLCEITLDGNVYRT